MFLQVNKRYDKAYNIQKENYMSHYYEKKKGDRE